MHLNDLLRGEGIDPNEVIVLRHAPKDLPELRNDFLWLMENKHELFNAYQQTQGPRVEKAMLRAKVVASFIGHEPGKALFAGLYRINGEPKPLSFKQFWQVPYNAELKSKYGMDGMTDKRSTTLWFDLVRLPHFEHMKGSMTIRWPGKEISWWRRAARNTFRILEARDKLADSVSPPGNRPTMKSLSKKPAGGGLKLPLKDERDIERLQQALTVASRRLHNKLTNRLRDRLCDHELLEGASADAMFDVLVRYFDGNHDLLIEAKSSIEGPQIRMAVGQLFDYWYRLHGPTDAYLALLVPEKPDHTTGQMLEWLDIGVLWFEEDRLATRTKWLKCLTGD